MISTYDFLIVAPGKISVAELASEAERKLTTDDG